jgi:hypothetical protein
MRHEQHEQHVTRAVPLVTECATDLIGDRDGDDSPLQRHAGSWRRDEREPSDTLAAAQDVELDTFSGELEARTREAPRPATFDRPVVLHVSRSRLVVGCRVRHCFEPAGVKIQQLAQLLRDADDLAGVRS